MADQIIDSYNGSTALSALAFGAVGAAPTPVTLATPLPVRVAGVDTVIMPESLGDGADVTQGAKADAAWSGTGAGSIVAILKAIWAALTGFLQVRMDGVSDGAVTTAWNGAAVSTVGYSSAYLEVTTYNTAITVKAGSAAANAVDVINTNGSASASTITATGLYLIPYLAGNLTLAGLGTGVVNLILKR